MEVRVIGLAYSLDVGGGGASKKKKGMNEKELLQVLTGWCMVPLTDMAKMGGGSNLEVKSSHHKLCDEMIS